MIKGFLGLVEGEAPADGYVMTWSGALGRAKWSSLTPGGLVFGSAAGGLSQSSSLTYTGGTLTVADSTASTGAGTGAFVVTGGAGFGGKVFIGNTTTAGATLGTGAVAVGNATDYVNIGGGLIYAQVSAAGGMTFKTTNSSNGITLTMDRASNARQTTIHHQLSGSDEWVAGVGFSNGGGPSLDYCWGPSTSLAAALMRLTTAGSLVVGSAAAISTSATDGFLYLPTCAGAPTGTPTSVTGKAAIVFDTTNNKLCVYNGAWKQTAALT